MDSYHFQSLDLYRQALDYLEHVSEVADALPPRKSVGVVHRLLDSAVHLVVQIAGRSSGESEIERSFMIDGALMSLFETIACLDIIRRRKLLPAARLEAAQESGLLLHESLQKKKKALKRR